MRSGFSRMKLHYHSSLSLPPVQLPSPMETHLWYVKPSQVKGESLLNQYLDILSPCEKENVSQMHGEELKKSALLARALVRTTIARYQINSQVSAKSLKFQKNIHGKPKVDWPSDNDWDPTQLHFNISHTSSLVACGVTINSQIGIDVEEKHRIIKHDILSFARRYFTQHELQSLASILDPQVRQQEFIKLWTLKEAYVKALGKGFSGAPFSKFNICMNSVRSDYNAVEYRCSETMAPEITVEPIDGSGDLTSNWQFLLLELVGSHYAAICTEGGRDAPMKLKVWNTVPLVEDKRVSGTDAVKVIGGLR